MIKILTFLLLPATVFSQGVFSFGGDSVVVSSSSPESLDFAWRKTGSSPSLFYLAAGEKKMVLSKEVANGNYVVSCVKTEDWDDEVVFECNQNDTFGSESTKEISLEKEKNYLVGIKDNFSNVQSEYYTLSVSAKGNILLQKKL